MSTLARVIAEARTGATLDVIAARLGVAPALVELMVGELRRDGLVAPDPRAAADRAAGCGPCAPVPAAPAACAGCPLAAR